MNRKWCQKCHKKEVKFTAKKDVEKFHVCQDCAEKLGIIGWLVVSHDAPIEP